MNDIMEKKKKVILELMNDKTYISNEVQGTLQWF